MGWTGARRLLIAIFLAVDLFLAVLLHLSGPISSGAGTVAALPPGAVANPLGAGVHELPLERMRILAAASVARTLFGTLPPAVEQANGSLRYQRGADWVAETVGGAVWVSVAPSPAELPVTSPAAAVSAAQSLLTALRLPNGLGELTLHTSGKTTTVVFGQTVNGLPVLGATLLVVERPSGQNWLVEARLNQVVQLGGRASLLSAAEALAYAAAIGGSGRVEAMALTYPLGGRNWQTLAPQWVLTAVGQTVRIDAFSGEEIP